MSTKIFVNLPVKDLERSKEFFLKLGFAINPQFTDENAASIVISEEIYCMFLKEEFFKTFTKKEIADTSKVIETINAFALDSKEEVDVIFNKAIAAGGIETRPAEIHADWMYGRSFADLDGHEWEFTYLDLSKAPQKPNA